MTETEQLICRAPTGRLRLIHTDARDHWPSNLGDYDGINEIRIPLRQMTPMEREEVKVFNDEGKVVAIAS